MTPAPVGFDLDMTLIDSRAAILGSVAQGVAAETGVAIDPDEVDRRLGIKLEDELAQKIPGQLGHDRIAAAVASVAQAGRAAGKFVGFGGVYQPDLLKKYIGLGMRMVLCGNDVGLLLAADERATFVRNCVV